MISDRSGVASWAVLAVAIGGLVILVRNLLRVWRLQSVQGWWWMVAPGLMLCSGFAGALLTLRMVGQVLPERPHYANVYTGLVLTLNPLMLGFLATAALLAVQSLGLTIVLLGQGSSGGRSLDLNRMALAGFTAMITASAAVAYDATTGWRWLGFRSAMNGWLELLLAVSAIGIVCLVLASLRRLNRWEHLTIFSCSLLATVLIVVCMMLYANWLGFQSIATATAERKSVILALGHIRFVMLSHGWKFGLVAVAIVFTTGIPGLLGRQIATRKGPIRGVKIFATFALAPVLLGGLAGLLVQTRVRSLEPLPEARRLSDPEISLAFPIGKDGDAERSAWLPRMIPLPGNTCLAQHQDGAWKVRAVLPEYSDELGLSTGPAGQPTCPMYPLTPDLPLGHGTELVFAVPQGMLASEISSLHWLESGRYFQRGDFYFLLSDGWTAPSDVLARHSTPAMHFRWQSGIYANREWPLIMNSTYGSSVWLVDTDDGILVTSLASPSPWHVANTGEPMRKLGRQLTWDTDIYLVPGDHWTVQDIVSLCASVREFTSESCTLVDPDPTTYLEFEQQIREQTAKESAEQGAQPAHPLPSHGPSDSQL